MSALPGTVDRLFVVVRGDMPAGLKTAQAIHAARMWPFQDTEPTVVVFSCPAERFEELLARASAHPIRIWHEPDQDNAATAFSTSEKTAIKAMKLQLL